jgi:serine/threonine protein kinase
LNPERWQQISRIFKSAISLDPEARNAYVAGQCGSDNSLRAEVEKLLASHQQASAEDFIGGLAAEAAAPLLVIEDEAGPPQRTLSNGQQFGSYVILEALGAGGMGEVYLARDTRLDRTVALKILPPDISRDNHRMQRFRQEAKVASSLNQPNILTVFEFGEVGGLTFLATEFVEGETLRDHLRGKKKLKLAEILDINIQVLAALDAAHEANIVHRDIKPENVMIRRRDHVVKVLDFGLAKVTEKKISKGEEESEAATAFKTAPGIIMGTVNYMSPEQAQAAATDQRTDIWSTGVMIYEMVSGLQPFKGPTDSHTIVQILEKDPVPLTNFTQIKVPAELQRIVAKSLAKNAEDRYQTAKDMLIDLRTLKRQLDVETEIHRTSHPTTPIAAVVPAEVRNERGKRRVLAIALIGMSVVTAAIVGINVWRSSRARTTASSPPPAAAPERSLSYWITVQRFRNQKPYLAPFQMPGEIIFEKDYQIRLSVGSPQEGYLYVLNEGPEQLPARPEFVVLFPSSTANNGSAHLSAGQTVQIPEQTWIQFDSEQGTEKLWLVFSQEPVEDLERAKAFANRRDRGLIPDSNLNQAVDAILKNPSLPKPAVEKDSAKTTLKVTNNLLVHPVKLEHLGAR